MSSLLAMTGVITVADVVRATAGAMPTRAMMPAAVPTSTVPTTVAAFCRCCLWPTYDGQRNDQSCCCQKPCACHDAVLSWSQVFCVPVVLYA